MKKGFTLIELLVVIAIVAVLAVAVVLVLNPAELLRQGRDATRLSDMGTLSGAIALYMSDVTTPSLGTVTSCYVYNAVAPTLPANCDGRHAVTRTTAWDADRTTDGNGWIPINLSAVSVGSPLSILPIDPAHSAVTGGQFYSYANTATTWEIDANLESTKFATQEGVDGGDKPALYEVGNDPGLDI